MFPPKLSYPKSWSVFTIEVKQALSRHGTVDDRIAHHAPRIDIVSDIMVRNLWIMERPAVDRRGCFGSMVWAGQ